MTDVKHIDIKEFREIGFLQEANRLFFHPHGLALEVTIDETGAESLSGVWDYRDDPEGIVYGDGEPAMRERADRVFAERERHYARRARLFGYGDAIGRPEDAPGYVAEQLERAEQLDVEPVDWTYPQEAE